MFTVIFNILAKALYNILAKAYRYVNSSGSQLLAKEVFKLQWARHPF